MTRRLIAALLLPALIVLLACGDGMATYPDNDGIPGNCEFADAAYARPNLFPRFDLNTNTLSLVDWNTGDTAQLLATFDSVAYMSVLSWSPDCRYLMTHQRGDGVIWDTLNGGEVVRFTDVPNFTRTTTSITWDSSTRYVTIESAGSTLLYTLATRQTLTLSDHYFVRQYWDLQRQQLIGISAREVAAYDLRTGARVATFEGVSGSWRAVFSDDYSRVAFYSDAYHPYQPDMRLHVFDRDTMQHTVFFIGDYIQTGHIAFSPDNRYLVIGGALLSVWDLQNPPTQADTRAPTFQHDGPLGYITSVRFVAPAVVGTTSGEGVRRWDLFTGAQVG